jgi:hypothetical protein
VSKRQLKPLPLPRSWLTYSHPETRLTDRELALSGKSLNPGTKASLRSMLLNAGWDADIVDSVLNDKFIARNSVTDLFQVKEPDFNEAILRLKAKGFGAELLTKKQEEAPLHTIELWDSLTRYPWWTSALRGPRTVVLTSTRASAVRRASAGFMRDLWANLGEAPEHRLPSVQRVNMLGFASADGVNTFKQSLADRTGVIVAHGLDTSDFIYQMFGYAAALAQVAPHAFLVYEAVPPEGVSLETVLAAAQRSGFAHVFGVRRG